MTIASTKSGVLPAESRIAAETVNVVLAVVTPVDVADIPACQTPLYIVAPVIKLSTYCLVVKFALDVGVIPFTKPIKVASPAASIVKGTTPEFPLRIEKTLLTFFNCNTLVPA